MRLYLFRLAGWSQARRPAAECELEGARGQPYKFSRCTDLSGISENALVTDARRALPPIYISFYIFCNFVSKKKIFSLKSRDKSPKKK